MTFTTRVTSQIERSTVIWGARTATHSYELTVDVDAALCYEPPRWVHFDFAGAGELSVENCDGEIAEQILTLGLTLVEGTLRLREVTPIEFAEIATLRQTPALGNGQARGH